MFLLTIYFTVFIKKQSQPLKKIFTEKCFHSRVKKGKHIFFAIKRRNSPKSCQKMQISQNTAITEKNYI